LETINEEVKPKLKKIVSFNAAEHSSRTRPENHVINREPAKELSNITTPRNVEDPAALSVDLSRVSSPMDHIIDAMNMSRGVSLLIGGQVRKKGLPLSTASSAKAFRITKNEFFRL
jgi:hypothetical protein